MRQLAALTVLLLCCAGALADDEAGLVLHYAFDEGEGKVVRDKSPHGNHGKIVGKAGWVTEPYTALDLEEAGGHIECPASPSLELAKSGTLEVWCRPRLIQGGLISWHTGQNWSDQRLVLAFMSWKDSRLIGVMSDAENSLQIREPLEVGKWAHLVYTFDGANVQMYVNGDPMGWRRQGFLPEVKGVRLRIGTCEGLGQARFAGKLKEVRVYNRAISAKEVAGRFIRGAQQLGLKFPRQVRLTQRFHARRAELEVTADLVKVGKLPARSFLQVQLLNEKGKSVRDEVIAPIPAGTDKLDATLKTDDLYAGLYKIRAFVKNSDTGNYVSEESEAQWYLPKIAQLRDARPDKKVLNNLVTQLVHVEDLPGKPYQKITFDNPRKGWVFVTSTARLRNHGLIAVSIDTEKDTPLFRHRYGDKPTMEAMRLLDAGEHKVRIFADPDRKGASPAIASLTVRAIPALMYCAYPATAHSGYGSYDFDFLSKDVLPNINTIIGSGTAVYSPDQRAWKERGGQWFLEQNIPSLIRAHLKDVPDPLTADYTFNYWTGSTGFTNPYLDGVMADEFGGGNSLDYHGYIEAVKRIAADPQFKGKSVHAWCGAMYTPSLGKDFAQTVIDAGYKIAWEVYLPERPTAKAARAYLDLRIRRELDLWTKAFPGFPKDMICVLGILCAQPETCNLNPQVDYKVYLDMQYHHLANSPESYGLYGVMVYKSTYAEEEAVRWAGRLFRHYCIEGNTGLLSERYGFKYELDHIRNGDFDDGLAGWDVSAAAEGSVKTQTRRRLGQLFGRYGASDAGNSCLWMKRSADKPNSVSQQIGGLRPGRFYSMKMIAADWQDGLNGVPEKKKLAVSIKLDNVERIPSKSFVSTIRGIYRIGPFEGKDSGPYYNHHRIVFRANAPTAKLTISDWTDDKTPGGPVGQETMINFIEIQPYLE